MHLYAQPAAVSDAKPVNALRYRYISVGESGVITTSLSNDERLGALAKLADDVICERMGIVENAGTMARPPLFRLGRPCNRPYALVMSRKIVSLLQSISFRGRSRRSKHTGPAMTCRLMMHRTTHTRVDSHSVRTTIGGYALEIAKALEHHGVDSTRIFRAVGVPPSLLKNDPMCRLAVDTMSRLYRACVDVTHNAYFGLTVARFIHVSNFHALGHALAASPNLMAFCQRLERAFRLATQACEIELSESASEVSLRANLLAKTSGETEDAAMGFIVLAMRQLYVPSFSPLCGWNRSFPTRFFCGVGDRSWPNPVRR
jgi:Arabinose-binding domain of AraC transcription regulator, N-term